MAMQYNPYGYNVNQFYQQQGMVPGYLNQNAVNGGMQMQPQIQQYQQPQAMPDKVVESIDVVNVTDIPMDGSIHCFPKADWSEIYTKRWLADVTTKVDVYKRVDLIDQNKIEDQPSQPQEPSKELADKEMIEQAVGGINAWINQLGSDMSGRMSDLESRIAKLDKMITAINKNISGDKK